MSFLIYHFRFTLYRGVKTKSWGEKVVHILGARLMGRGRRCAKEGEGDVTGERKRSRPSEILVRKDSAGQWLAPFACY